MATVKIVTRNNGPSRAEGVSVKISGIENIEITDVDISKGTFDSPVWDVGTLEETEEQTIELEGEIVSGDEEVPLTFTVSSVTPDMDISNNTVTTVLEQINHEHNFTFFIDPNLSSELDSFQFVDASGILHWMGEKIPVMGDGSITLGIPNSPEVQVGYFEGVSDSIMMSGCMGLIEVERFGEHDASSYRFSGCRNLETIPDSIPSTVTDIDAIFASSGLYEFPSTWDFSNIVSMNEAFSGLYLYDVYLNDISNVIYASSSFGGTEIHEMDIGEFPQADSNFYNIGGFLSGVTVESLKISGTYYGRDLNGIGSGLNIRKFISTNEMPELTKLTFNSWEGWMMPLEEVHLGNMPKLVDCNGLFIANSNLEEFSAGSIPLPCDFTQAFYGCRNITDGTISFDEVHPTEAMYMFGGTGISRIPDNVFFDACTGLNWFIQNTNVSGELTLPDLPSVEFGNGFNSAPSSIQHMIAGTNVTKFNLGNMTNESGSPVTMTLYFPATLEELNIGSIQMASDVQFYPDGMNNLRNIVIGDLPRLDKIGSFGSLSNSVPVSITLGDIPSCTEVGYTGLTHLTVGKIRDEGIGIALSGSPSIETIEFTKDSYPKILYIEVGGVNSLQDHVMADWDVTPITNMDSMFYGSLLNPDISKWDVSGVTSMFSMLAGASNFNQDLSGWDVGHFEEKPDGFDEGTTSWVLPKPPWNEPVPEPEPKPHSLYGTFEVSITPDLIDGRLGYLMEGEDRAQGTITPDDTPLYAVFGDTITGQYMNMRTFIYGGYDTVNPPIVDISVRGFSLDLTFKEVVDGVLEYSYTSPVPVSVFDVGSLVEASITITKNPMSSDIPTTIGEPFGGGFYAGNIVDGGTEYALIVADVSADITGDESRWKISRNATAGTDSLSDGPGNTQAMINAGIDLHPAARHCIGHNGGGNSDWYMPAKDELNVIYLNLGYNRPDCPAHFQSGGEQAFSEALYWASTQSSAGNGWVQHFSNGFETYDSKDRTTHRVRPIRRIPV